MIGPADKPAGDSPHVIGLLLAVRALAIGFDPGRASPDIDRPRQRGRALASSLARGDRHGPSPRLDLGCARPGRCRARAQLVALTEPLSSGRPMAGRLTYLCVLAILAALVSVLNARTPGERVWAGLMVLLVVVFLIPWLEEAGRIRRAQGVVLVHLDSPWTIFYGLLVVVGVTNYLPTRFGLAAACLGLALDPGVSRADPGGLAGRAAGRRVGVGGLDVRRRRLGRALERGPRECGQPGSIGSGSGSATTGGSSGPAQSGTVQSHGGAGGMAGPADLVWPGGCRRAR